MPTPRRLHRQSGNGEMPKDMLRKMRLESHAAWIYSKRKVSPLLAPSHHSITSSARASNEAGTSRPSVFDACQLKQQCCPKMLFRKVTRDINEDARDLARALMGTPEFDKSRDERKKVGLPTSRPIIALSACD